uniref:gp53-like domain-containing protein n=1 Tax=Pseudomonas veronii TaxID=76761 RepID=UPI0035E3D9DA
MRLAIPATTLSGYGITDAYTKSQIDASLLPKANSATTLGGYGITDAYTKAQSNATFPFSDNALTIGFVSSDVTKPYIQSRTDNNIYRLQPLLGQATESTQGAVAIATQAVTNAGTDDAGAITAKKLKFGFASLISANGYLKFPDWLGGFIIQWGNASIGDDTIVDVTLPISFPNSFFAAIATAQINVAVTGANTLSATAYKKSLSVVSIGMNQGTAVVPATSGVDYICIGR